MTPEAVVEVSLTRGKVATVSQVDFWRLSSYKWVAQYNKHSGKWYAATTITEGSFRRKVYMHRLITACPRNLVVDHVDCDGLHNWRENLRITTHRNNALNHSAHGGIPYRGVTQDGKRYRARCNGKHLGNFERVEEAAVAYDMAALEQYGEFAWLNYPELRPQEARTPEPLQIPY